MKLFDTSDYAASNLRLALPMMAKHKIPPNPLNYALWYAYFSKQKPALNVAMDNAIGAHGTFPPNVTNELFSTYVSDVDESKEQEFSLLNDKFSEVVEGLSDSMDETSKVSDSFASVLMEGVDKVLGKAVDAELISELNTVKANADSLCVSNAKFQTCLVSAQSEIATLKAKLEESREEAIKDPLTGLYNRRQFNTVYEDFVSLNDDKDISLIMMDIDKFKSFNDTYGHVLGDQVLKFVGKFLNRECEGGGLTAFRLGGEEFAVLCRNANIDAANSVAQSLCKKLANTNLKSQKKDGVTLNVTASFGVTKKVAGDALESMVERADGALYKAKDGGRNQVKIAA